MSTDFVSNAEIHWAAHMQQLPKRCLHIVDNLDGCAVETWLVRMLRQARRHGKELDWTFYCTRGSGGAMDDEARALGAKVIHSPVPIGKKAEFVRALRAELRRGHYDVLHCHHDLVNAVYLLAAIGTSIRHRIVHVHNADENVLTPNWVKRRLYREPMRRACISMADRIVGISGHTLDTFLAGRPRRSGHDVVHYYGLDPTRFENVKVERVDFRRQLGFPDDALILLFAGRMVPEKNPLFAVEVLSQLRVLEARAVAVFAGAGSLEADVRAKVRERNLESVVRLLGWRNDLPEIMSAADWFILPHPEQPMEGFGIAVVEAQLAGLRLLLSRGIADDPLLPTAVFRRLPLAAEPTEWAQGAIDLLQEQPSRTAAIEALKHSPMDMDLALDELLKLHTFDESFPSA
jgi:glycosyltransferase EpsF